MTTPNTELSYQTALVNADTEHLKILTICWYIWSGLIALGGLIPLIYVVVGVVFIAVPSSVGSPHPHPSDPSPAIIGGIMIGVGLLISLLIWTLAFFSFLTAQSLRQRRRKVLCFVCAILACLSIPLGLLLGIFTLIVLSRQSVQNLFTNTAQLGPA